MLTKYGGGLGLLASLAACQPQADGGASHAEAHPPTGHFTGTLTAAGHPTLRAALEVRHPRPGRYDAEMLIEAAPELSFVADTLAFAASTLRIGRPGQPGQVLTLQQQGDFWRGTLVVDSVSYSTLLVRRGPPTPAVYRVQRRAVAGAAGAALLFSPADETLPGAALALFPTGATVAASPAWADALARHGYTVLLLPAADSLAPAALTAALGYLHHTPGVDTARVGAWAAGLPAEQLATLLAMPALPRPHPAFVVAQEPPLPSPAARRAWHTLSQHGRVLAVYPPTQTRATVAAMQAALGRPRVRQGPASYLTTQVTDWLNAK